MWMLGRFRCVQISYNYSASCKLYYTTEDKITKYLVRQACAATFTKRAAEERPRHCADSADSQPVYCFLTSGKVREDNKFYSGRPLLPLLLLLGIIFGYEDSGIWSIFYFSDLSHLPRQRPSYRIVTTFIEPSIWFWHRQCGCVASL